MEIVSDGPTLVLSGDFDVRSTWEVRNALREHLHGHEQDVVVDLTDVTTMDLTAARVLAYASREAGRSGNHVTLRGCGPAVRRMLHLSHLMRVRRRRARRRLRLSALAGGGFEARRWRSSHLDHREAAGCVTGSSRSDTPHGGTVTGR